MQLKSGRRFCALYRLGKRFPAGKAHKTGRSSATRPDRSALYVVGKRFPAT
jgi:hypothetical protein